MAIKGTATIELTNADGSKEIIKHDNMITNAVNDLCLSQRGEQAAILKMVNQNESYAQAMFGGLLLFGETLNDDADDYEIPTTNIVGYASQDAYAGLDIARGSFNQSEGGVQADGSYKFVWDFATSQGNGTIKSLALCPNIMGRIGASDSIVSSEIKEFQFVKDPTAPFDTVGYMLDYNGNTNGISNYNYDIVAIVGDIAYATDKENILSYYKNTGNSACIINNGNILHLHKFKLGATSISLADRVATARYIETVNVQLPQSMLDCYVSPGGTTFSVVSCYYNQRDNKLVVFPCNIKSSYRGVNKTITYADIDLGNNMQVTSYTFTNTTENTMIGSGMGVGMAKDFYDFCVFEDYILVIAGEINNRRLYVVNRNDNSNVKKVQFNGGELILDTTKGTSFTPFFVNKNTVVIGFNYDHTQTYDGVYIVDFSTGIAKKTNAGSYTPFNTYCTCSFGNKVVKVKTGSYLTYYVTINPFILTTKNNLDAPVQKTASQTMKITYTLSEVSEV